MEFNEKFLNNKKIFGAFVQQARYVQPYELGITPKTPTETIIKRFVSFGDMGEIVALKVKNVTLYSFMSENEMRKALSEQEMQIQK